MNSRALLRPHLATFRAARIPHRFTDVLVVGSGVAGLSACVAVTRQRDVEVILLAKAAFSECATERAQGGIAAVLEPGACADSTDGHAADTVRAACGLAVPEIVEGVVTEGVDAVRELVAAGACFDLDDGRTHFTREGGHSRPRILHTADRTGREIFRVLFDAVARLPNITSLRDVFAVDILADDHGACRGVLVYRPTVGLQAIWAKRTVLATGGAGRLYRETTNPPVSTGDGLAMAFRAGATLRDMEFVQFHPTTLYVAGADRFLITEAMRGEGGVLVDSQGERFMARYHPKAELAPRDVVSRAIAHRMQKTGDNRVFLDLTALSEARIRQRFPYILRICQEVGIDITREPIPVRPSAHYTIGGIVVDHDGATDLAGLFAVGEVASTGLHGANRLGSNSLLEGLVFGGRAGLRAATEARTEGRRLCEPVLVPGKTSDIGETRGASGLDLADLRRSLQSLLWHDAGIERHGPRLSRALAQVEEWISYVLPVSFRDPEGWTLQNMLTTAALIIRGALLREESRGVHYREDFPESREEWRRHQEVSRRDFADGA